MLFDSHCHLTAPAFREDLEGVLDRSREAGVEGIVSIASTPADTITGLALARQYEGIWTTAGVHPHEAGSGGNQLLEEVSDLLERDGVVAVGECGLDYHYNHAPRSDQRRVFEAQVRLAAASGLPLVIHSRSCDGDMAAAIADFPREVRGVLHCFTGSDELLETALEHGLHISFTGIVTFKSFSAWHQVSAVPRERIMVETDAPYLAPVPYRGERNEPARVRLVAEAVASARDEGLEEVASYTTENAKRFYGVG